MTPVPSSSSRLGGDRPRSPSELAVAALKACRRADAMVERMRIILDEEGTSEASQARLLAMDSDASKLTAAGLRAGAFGGDPFPADTMSSAIAQAGLDRAVEGALAIHYLFACAEAGRQGGLHVKSFFCRSVGSGVAARALGMARGYDSRTSFAMGLLHDAGRLALALQHGPAYLDLGRESTPAAEREAFGIDHTQAGLAILIHRGFPPQVCEAAAFHHGAIDRISVASRLAAASSLLSAHSIREESAQMASEWLGIPLSAAQEGAREAGRAMDAVQKLVGG